LAKEVRYSCVTGSQTFVRVQSISMAEQDWNTNDNSARENRRSTKKQYQDPAFRHERVFETMALSCGKVQPTQLMCHFHRNAS
jgi:hypothetical protein